MFKFKILRLLGLAMILQTSNGLINQQLDDEGTLEISTHNTLLFGIPSEYVYWRDIEPGFVLELTFSDVWTGPEATTIYTKNSKGSWETMRTIRGYFPSPFTLLIYSVDEVAITVPAAPGQMIINYQYFETCAHYCEVSVQTKSYEISCDRLEDKYETVCTQCRITGQCSPIASSPTFGTTPSTIPPLPTTNEPVTCPGFEPSVITSCSNDFNPGSYCVLQCDVGYHPRSLDSPHLLVQCVEDFLGIGFWSKETDNFCLSMETITALCLPRTEQCPYNITEMLSILDEENIFDEEENGFFINTSERSLSFGAPQPQSENERCRLHCGIFKLKTGKLGPYPCGMFRDNSRVIECLKCRYMGNKCRGNAVAFS